VRFLNADVFALPAYQTPFAAAYFVSGFEGLALGELLSRTVLLVSHGGHIVIAQTNEHCKLPDEEALRHLIAGLPLRLVSFSDEPGLRHAVLQVPPWFALPQGPVRLDAPVVTGFGRGSRQLGVPTANMSTSVLGPALLSTLPRGVYYGWARLEGDHVPRKAVLNVGVCPTFSAAQPAETTVEVHLLHSYPSDFYGARLRVLVLGFIRPEMKFEGGLPQLVARIRQDVGMASSLLDAPHNAATAGDSFLA
jgi:riboflavin kinase